MSFYNKINNVCNLEVKNLISQQKQHMNFAKFLICSLPGSIKSIKLDGFENEINVEIGFLQSVILFLKQHTNCQYKLLTDIIAYDIPGNEKRFSIIYHLISIRYNSRVRILVETDEVVSLPSMTSIYSGAAWYEREIWDLFGISFYNHPDLRRILTDYGFEGHPLRKDFPLSGFLELFYEDSSKKVVYEPVSLAQEYRNFGFITPWKVDDKIKI